jgi:hypothetical protein
MIQAFARRWACQPTDREPLGVTKRAEALIAAVYLAGTHSRFGQARAALEHFQGLMRQHLRALV